MRTIFSAGLLSLFAVVLAGGAMSHNAEPASGDTATPTPTPALGPWVTVFSSDFEGAVEPEWSTTTTDETPLFGRRFLGQFVNNTVSLTLSGLPQHTHASVSFDLFIIRTWDGNGTTFGPDIWGLSVEGGPTLLRTTFSSAHGSVTHRQAYPEWYPGGDNPDQTGASAVNTLGFIGQFGLQDSTYDLGFTFPHTSSSLVLDFSAAGLQWLADESWGLDNVTVSISSTVPPTPTATPPGQTATPTPEPSYSGDLNCDGAVTSVDSLAILRYVAGLPPLVQHESCTDVGFGNPLMGDVNCDGQVMAVDSLFILRHVAGLPVNLPPGCPAVG